MPIEISELHIKIKVDKGKSTKGVESSGKNDQAFQQSFLAECIEEVMQLLKDKKER